MAQPTLQGARADFWEAFGAFMQQHDAPFKPTERSPVISIGRGLGRAGVELRVTLRTEEQDNLHDCTVTVLVRVNGKKQPGLYQALHQQRAAIAKELGFQPGWDDPEPQEAGDKVFASAWSPRDMHLDNQRSWPQTFAWVLERMAAFHRVFGPKLRAMGEARA